MFTFSSNIASGILRPQCRRLRARIAAVPSAPPRSSKPPSIQELVGRQLLAHAQAE